ncbi:MAG: ATP-binding protein [Dehalococcoidia bacterium]|nr:ATP-binding protein [Dehalococcoidia bacterium]
MMSNKKPTYKELERRLTDAEAIIAALRKGEVDAIVSGRNVALLRVKELEEALRSAKDDLEVRVQERTAELDKANKALRMDIIKRKEAEEREKQLQQELNLASRLASIGRLAAGIAHEINNPLTAILGFSQRLLRKSTDTKVNRDLEIIRSEAQRAANVVENLLTFARRREPKKEYSDINDIVHKALQLRAYQLKTNNIEVVTDFAPGFPKAMVDFHQIQQVFLNLILNAEQAMSEVNRRGKLVIKTRGIKDYIRIAFTDDGPGIPAEHLDKIFDPFFTTRGEGGGTGLGLSICHGIVVEHGGRIYAQGKPGEGTTFFVELPLTTEKNGSKAVGSQLTRTNR